MRISDTKKSRDQQWECSKELRGELGQECCTVRLESWFCELTGNQVVGKLVHLTEHSFCIHRVWIVVHCGFCVCVCVCVCVCGCVIKDLAHSAGLVNGSSDGNHDDDDGGDGGGSNLKII